MSVPRNFGLNGQKIGSNIAQPVECDLSFTVDSANANGLGIRSLKSNGYIQNVFMHTSSTPGSNNGQTNPNPISGYIVVQFKNNFNVSLAEMSSFVAPFTGSATQSITAGHAYTIASLGTTTTAQWQTAGVLPGFTPNVNTAFIAASTGTISGTGTVYVPGVSGIDHIETVGDPNQTISNSNIAASNGAFMILQCLASGSLTAPNNNSVINLQLRFDRSSVSISDSTGVSGL